MISFEEKNKRRNAYRLKKHLESKVVECACGCGEKFHEMSKGGSLRKYVSGHNGRKYPIGSDSHVERRKQLCKESATIKCGCGCGKDMKSVNKHGASVRFIYGHRPDSRYRTKEEKAHQGQIRYRNNKIRGLKYLGAKCKKCGLEYNNKNACIFHFHHKEPENKKSILAKKFSGSFEKAVTELDKCILLCANCHSIEHSQGEW